MNGTLDPSQLLMVHSTLEVIDDRIDEDPPQVAIDTDDDEFRKQLVESAKKGAYAYDVYRDLRQVSFLHCPGPGTPKYEHFMFCDDPDVDIEEVSVSGAERSIHVFDSEAILAKAVSEYLCAHYVSCQGAAVKWRWLAGWKVGIDLWPFLLNKLLKYNACIPEMLATDITRRYSTTQYLMDVSNIYGQGISTGMRKLPSCQDVLKYWGYRPHASGHEIRELVCNDPERSTTLIEPYLEDMFDVVLRYQGVGEPWR